MFLQLVISAVAAILAGIFGILFVPGPKHWSPSSEYGGKLFPFSEFKVNNAFDNRTISKYRIDGIGAETLVLLPNPSSIVLGYVGLSDGWITQVNRDFSFEKLVFVNGRPLGGVADQISKSIYFCVAPVGLVQIDLSNFDVSILTSISNDGIPIRFPDDVALSSTGIFYFTDATNVVPEVDELGNYDTDYASLIDAGQGSGAGRLIQYDPTTKNTTTLLHGLNFANGIALSPDETYVCFAETYSFKITRYYIAGPKYGLSDTFSSSLPGCPDGIRLSPSGDYFWVAIYTPVTPALITVLKNRWLGYILSGVNKKYLPKAIPYGAVLRLYTNGTIAETLQDPTGKAIKGITSAIEFEGFLYLGSTKLDFLGIYKLKQNN